MDSETLIALIVSLAAIVFIVYHMLFKKSKNAKKEPFEEKKKVLKYFGGDHCPHSNINSHAYKAIKDFEKEFGDKVEVNYYWAGLDNDIMRELNIEYVPYLLNGENQHIELGLPKDTDINKHTEAELKALLLNTIYSKL